MNTGKLDTANFKTCLMRSDLKLNVKDINRIVRYLPKTSNNIDYYDFLLRVERVDTYLPAASYSTAAAATLDDFT